MSMLHDPNWLIPFSMLTIRSSLFGHRSDSDACNVLLPTTRTATTLEMFKPFSALVASGSTAIPPRTVLELPTQWVEAPSHLLHWL